MEQKYIKGVLVDEEFDEAIGMLLEDQEDFNRIISWGENDPDMYPNFCKRLAQAGVLEKISESPASTKYKFTRGIGEEFFAQVMFYLESRNENGDA